MFHQRALLLSLCLIGLLFAGGARAQDQPLQVEVGVYLTSVDRFSLDTGLYTAELYVSFQCDRPCTEDDVAFDMPATFIGSKELNQARDDFYEYLIQAEVSQNDINLRRFPFDHHRLSIQVESKHPEDEVILTHSDERSALDADLQVLGWEVSPVYLTNVRDKSYHGDDRVYDRYIFSIELSNPPMVGLLKVMLPALVFMLIGLSSVFLPDRAAKIGLASGILLTLVFHSLGATGDLPSVGYVIYFDVFMLVNYVLLLAQIGVHVYEIILDNRLKQPERADHFSRRALSILIPLWVFAQIVVFVVMQQMG
jgi:hypothetical protein